MPPPSAPATDQAHIRNLAESLSLDGLRNAVTVLQLELDKREGRAKYQLPDQARSLLN
jgi:hypothetical protein